MRLQQFLTRNGTPYHSVDIETDPDVGELLERFHVRVEEVPVVICHTQKVLRNPSNQQIAECLGMNPQIDDATVRDVLVVGAGPAGLAAAVYAASEGLDVLVLETIATSAVRLRCDRRPYEIELSNGHTVRGRTVIIATGAEYRQLSLPNLARFVGDGVFYAATNVEARLCTNEEIIVVGGGNSAGQAAVFLAEGCRAVNVFVRADGLADSMSRYLIRRIEEASNITLHVRTQITALDGKDRLERVSWRNAVDNVETTRDMHLVFLMTGANPNTRWLQGCVPLDDKGFVRVGSDLRAEDLLATRWSRPRAPYLMETGIPGIFAVGDVRSGSVKRVASAVGEGSISIQLVHRVLQE